MSIEAEQLSISKMGALCPEWEHYVQNGSIMSRMGALCPEWEHYVLNGSIMSRMGALCPEWELNAGIPKDGLSFLFSGTVCL